MKAGKDHHPAGDADLNKEVIKKYDVVFPMLAGVGDTAQHARRS